MPLTLKSGTVLTEKDIEEIADIFAQSVQVNIVHFMNNLSRNRAKDSQDSERPQ